MLIVIPTRNRIKELTNTLNFLNNNNFFFKKIVIVDSSNFNIKKKIKKKINSYDLNIKLEDSQPSTCLQRNIGFNFIENEEHIMFLDDDNIFFEDAFYKMQIFLKTNINFVGVAFNQIYNFQDSFLEKIKKNLIFKKIGIYSPENGGFAKSGWQSKFINFENDEIVEWLPTRAVIYKTAFIKNLKFDDNLGIYGYLEDLDFSLELKKRGKLMVCSKAKYTHDQSIDRSDFKFGKKEVRNRYYLVQKHNLNKFLFFITLIAKILINLKEGIFLKKNSLQRFFGNLVALISLNKLEK
jgi:GT2 family glycosyltransferase